MRLSRVWMGLAAVALIGAGATVGSDAVAQSGLVIGGNSSNFGRTTIRGGFMPDPWTTTITSGGSMDASRAGAGASCRGFVTAQPDYIVDYANAAGFLRFYFEGAGDTTIIVNDASGRWHCNDDSWGGLNPTVDIRRPPSGQYDVWIGSYRAGQNVRGTLHVTELQGNHP